VKLNEEGREFLGCLLSMPWRCLLTADAAVVARRGS